LKSFPNNTISNDNEIDEDVPDRAAYNTDSLPLLLTEGFLGLERVINANSDRESTHAIDVMKFPNSENRAECGADELANQSMFSDEFGPFVTLGLSSPSIEDHFLSNFQHILPPANQTTDVADTHLPSFSKKPRYMPWQ